MKWETKNIQPHFFYGTLYCCCLKTNSTQKLYKTKCMIRNFKPIMNTKEIISLTKNLELHIHQWNKHVRNRVIMTQSFKITAQRLQLRKLKIIMRDQIHDGYEQINISNVMWILCLRLKLEQTWSFHDPMPFSSCDGWIQAWNFEEMNQKSN